MKKEKKRINKKTAWALASLLLVLLLCCTSLTAFAAADTPSLDLSKKGSISLQLYSEENDAPVKDGTLALYQVADLYLENGNMAYENTAEFSSVTSALDAEDSELAAELAAYVSSNGIEGTYAEIASDGSVAFTELPLGMYLIIQTEQSTGYYAIEPFLVTVPMAGENSWVYDVDASPKTEIAVQPETPETPAGSSETPAASEKKEAEENAAALVTGEESSSGSGTGTSAEGAEALASSLPQTGQLYWPIPILLGVGIALIVFGTIFNRRKEHAREAQ